jgi:hypothetical protein
MMSLFWFESGMAWSALASPSGSEGAQIAGPGSTTASNSGRGRILTRCPVYFCSGFVPAIKPGVRTSYEPLSFRAFQRVCWPSTSQRANRPPFPLALPKRERKASHYGNVDYHLTCILGVGLYGNVARVLTRKTKYPLIKLSPCNP